MVNILMLPSLSLHAWNSPISDADTSAKTKNLTAVFIGINTSTKTVPKLILLP
jgi:hypothetical protein